MKDTLTNKFGSFQTSLDVANKDENLLIWKDKPPLRFTAGIADATTSVGTLAKNGAIQSQNIKGSTLALRTLRKLFEQNTYAMARATYRCLISLNRIEDAAKVDFTPSHLRNARAVGLAGMGELTLDFAEELTKSAPKAADYGITDLKYAALNNQWMQYSVAVGAPATARAKRFALTHELPGQFHATEVLFSELDDLIVQFRGTPEGDLFVDSWIQSRHVIDLGHHHTEPPTPPSTTTTTTTTTPTP